ncbi:hypothetical protein ABPG75_013789 [Micractinium tetrahymenae]
MEGPLAFLHTTSGCKEGMANAITELFQTVQAKEQQGFGPRADGLLMQLSSMAGWLLSAAEGYLESGGREESARWRRHAQGYLDGPMHSWQLWEAPAAELERCLARQGSAVQLTANELQRLFLLGQKRLCAHLAEPAQPAERAGLGRMEAAASAQLVALAPGSAACRLHLARSLASMGQREEAARAWRATLQVAASTKAHICTSKAVTSLLHLVVDGVEGPTFAAAEAFELLASAERALALAKAWLPSKQAVQQAQQELAGARDVIALLAGRSGGTAAVIPVLAQSSQQAAPGPPQASSRIATAACAGCGQTSFKLKRCARCGVARYCRCGEADMPEIVRVCKGPGLAQH